MFSIATFNILAQTLINREAYLYAGKSVLKAKNRQPLVLQEMLGLDADILVLQEVDAIHRHYAKPLMDAGYDWIYQTKKHGTFRSSEYVVPPKEELDSPGGHGLMIAWRKDEFKCINYKGIFYDEHPLCSPTRITPITNNIAQIIALEFVKRPGGIVLSNTHLYWRYQATYEKLRQLWILLAETHLWSDEIDQNTNRHIPNTSWPIVLCGDFNTEPMDAPYKLLTRTDLPLSRELLDTCRVVEHDGSHRDCEGGEKDMDTGFPDHTPEFLIEKILSFPPCRSAYADYEGNVGKERYELNPDRGRQWSGEPSFTTFADWKGTLDYILLSDSGRHELKEISISPLPPVNDLLPGLPNERHGSDHLPLRATLEYIGRRRDEDSTNQNGPIRRPSF